MKLHIGCGTVYLENYINIDPCPDYVVPDVPQDIFEQNRTTVDKYYKHDFCKSSGKVVADIMAGVYWIPFENQAFTEVRMLHVLEHIAHYKIKEALAEIGRVLVKGGEFIVAVPDVRETAKLLVNAKTPEEEDWCLRLVHGTQRNEWSHHLCGYVPRTLKKLLSENGFGNFEELPNINFYPAIHLKAQKL
jgi:SAM-dependent methyltransferase